MSPISNFLQNLQQKPEPVRRRIFWFAAFISAIVVVGLWFITFKKEVAGLNGNFLPRVGSSSTSVSAPHYLSVSRTEVKDGKLLIFFSVKNDTSDILNFSKAENIKLNVKNKEYHADKVNNRQNQQFVSKILSHSQNFGILEFKTSSTSGSGELSFDNLFFEQNPDSIFKEILPVDLNKLMKPETLRN